MVIESIDDFLYEIGLCHQSVRERTKRSKINSPKLIFAVLLVNLIRIILANSTDDETTLLLLADIGHLDGMKFFANISHFSLSSMVVFNQLIYNWNHKRGIEPTFLRLFQVLSGCLSPSAVGLTEESQCRSLSKIAKWLKPMHYNSTILVPLFCFLYIPRMYLVNLGFLNTIIYGSHSIIFHTTWFYYAINIVTTLFLFFIIICQYFLFKLSKLNSKMKTIKQTKTLRIRNILHSYNAIYREIDEYNTTYWSQFLFSVWLFFGVFLVIVISFLFFHLPIITVLPRKERHAGIE